MSSEVAISVRGIGKKYRVASAPRATTLAEQFVQTLRTGRGRRRSDFWALKDISLDVLPGEVVGVIGRNGAGKSTLLKILCRITEPSEGEARVVGRVGSLLEVGTGFHPELTGRENIFLNGAILGLSRRLVQRLFDEIVAFAGVEKFLDTPVKRYSSGMAVRLAFAVAAHLEPDVLVVDEVLAVGDAEFQRKCLGKLAEVSSTKGRTVLFVSHNMAAVETLCTRVVRLHAGRIDFDGPPAEGISRYLTDASGGEHETDRAERELSTAPRAHGDARFLRSVAVRTKDGQPTVQVPAGAAMMIDVGVESEFFTEGRYHVGIGITSDYGQVLTFVSSQLARVHPAEVPPSIVRCQIPSLHLVPGNYWLNLGVRLNTDSEWLDLVERAIQVEVLPTDFFGTGRLPLPGEGILLTSATFEMTAPPDGQMQS